MTQPPFGEQPPGFGGQPPGFGPPCWTTVQGCPVEVVPVVVPEPAETELDVP